MEVTTTYVNKEPYNEDEELEETNIDQEFRWKDEVTQKFRDLIDDIKRIKQDHYVDVSNINKSKIYSIQTHVQIQF